MGKYVNLREVKDFCRLNHEDLGYSSDGEFEVFLNDLIINVEGVIDRACNVPSGFFSNGGLQLTEIYDFRNPLMLKHYPVLAVNQIQFNMANIGETDNWQTVNSQNYRWTENGVIYFKADLTFPSETRQAVKVTYTAGYNQTPETIKYAVKQVCSRILHEILQRKISPVVRVDDWTVRMVESSMFTEEIKSLLAPYTRQFITVD